MVWFYFSFGHGKGVEIRKEQLTMDSTKLQNATNIVAFCKRKHKEEHLAYPNAH
jgi:hypothetical protein